MPRDTLSRADGSPFAERFGRLITLLRSGSGSASAVSAALDASVKAVARGGINLEAGVENSAETDPGSLKSRLLARQVDTVRIDAGASRDEILRLAKALADDELPLTDSEKVKVALIPVVRPPAGSGSTEAAGEARSSLRMGGIPEAPRREGTQDGISEAISSITDALTDALDRGDFRTVAHDVQALIRLLPAVPEHARRTVSISVRRYLNRPVLEALIQMALRTPEEQARVGEVLHWCGLDAAELMLEEIRHAEAVGPRAFLIDALGQMPEAYPLVLPLLGSPKWHEVRHGAELLGRFGNPGAIPGLKAQLQHADERVRLAAIEALSHFSDKTVLEPLRQALSHPSAVTRSHAGQALARRGSSALAMPLLVALEGEQDAVVWRELLGAMARMEAPEATAALVRLATERKSWFRRHGHSLHQRLEVVAALAASPSHSARQALERVAIEGDRTVREAARQALAKTSGAS